MPRAFSAALPAVLLLSITASAAERDLLRVFPAAQPPGDSRLAERHSVDNPSSFETYSSKAAWEHRAEFLRHQVMVAQGIWPLPERVPLNAMIHGKIDRDDYTVEKVFFVSIPGHYVTGNLYRPKGKAGKVPGVLCPHGHWTNGRLIWESDATVKKALASGAEQWEAGAHTPLQARCAMLARMGCVVFFYDLIGYADNGPLVHRQGFTDAEAVLRLQSQMGLQTWNSIRALDFLTSLPEVDATRIAVTGASGGGTQSIILAATDDRLATAFPAVMVGEAMQGGCVCENAPLLRVGTNNAEIVATFAPKPLAMSAANDWTVALEHVALPHIKSIYSLYNQPDRVAGKHFDFPHNYNQNSREFMYTWFNQQLKLGWKDPVKEKPFDPVPPPQLSVYDADHPRPADAADAPALRKLMTAASDQQLARLAKDDEQYGGVLKIALQAMVCDEMPGRDDVLIGRSTGPMRAGPFIYETAFIQRRGTGERIPAAVILPAEWGGNLVVWAHPDGKASLLGPDGQPTAPIQTLLNAHVGVMSADLFLTGEFVVAGKIPDLTIHDRYAGKANPPYAAFDLGYNRSVLANRVHDLVSLIALARGWQGTKSVHLVGIGKAGPWALLARVLADIAIDRAAIDLNGFDFDRVTEPKDEMFIPGALKYGGIYGFVPLCKNGETLLYDARKTGKYELAAATKRITLLGEKRSAEEMVEWVLK